MTAIVQIAGVALAAGLVWIPVREATGRRYFAFRRARQLGARLYAERAHQIGFASVEDREGGAYRGLAAAADVVARAVAAPEGLSWQALVACQDELFLVVQGMGAEILPEGDRIFSGEVAARQTCAAKTDWDAQWATPGLLPGARELRFEHAAVRVGDLARLRAVPFGGAGASRRAIMVAAVLVATLCYCAGLAPVRGGAGTGPGSPRTEPAPGTGVGSRRRSRPATSSRVAWRRRRPFPRCCRRCGA